MSYGQSGAAGHVREEGGVTHGFKGEISLIRNSFYVVMASSVMYKKISFQCYIYTCKKISSKSDEEKKIKEG